MCVCGDVVSHEGSCADRAKRGTALQCNGPDHDAPRLCGRCVCCVCCVWALCGRCVARYRGRNRASAVPKLHRTLDTATVMPKLSQCNGNANDLREQAPCQSLTALQSRFG